MTTPQALLFGSVTAAILAGTSSLALAAAVPAPLVVATVVALPQATPAALPRDIVTATSPLSGDQTKALEAFVSGYLNMLANAGPNTRALDDARRALIEPLRDPSATQVFRRAFSTAAIAQLTTIINGTDTQRAIHGLQVAAFMATPQSFALITGRLSASEGDVAKRQSAASTIGHALQLPAVKDFNAVDLAAVIRAITTAANAETQTTVVVQQLRALSIVATRDDVQPASAALARTNQITIVRGILTSIAASPKTDPRMVVVARAIAELQEQWTKLTSEASTLGPMIAPLLTETLQVGSKQWDAAHGDSDEADLYTETIAAAEVLLRVIDARLRSKAGEVTPASAVANAWKAGDKKVYDELVAKWSSAVNGPPYK